MANIELKGFKGLRGLDGLLTEASAIKHDSTFVQNFAVDNLIPGKYQPRKSVKEAELKNLAESITTQGIIQPLIIRKTATDHYEIVAGERRWRAAKLAGLQQVPAIVRAITDEVALAFALVENIQREDLNPIEEALAFSKFSTEFSMTHADIATLVGRSRASITNALRLLTLTDFVKEKVMESCLDMGHARALLSLTGDAQIMAAQQVIARSLSVRQTEQLVNRMLNPVSLKAYELDAPLQQKVDLWKKRISQQLATQVQVHFGSEGKGRVVIPFDSVEEADWLFNHLNVKE